jgi:hypothetical protein
MEQGVGEVSDTMSRASNEATLILGKGMRGRGKAH